MDLKISSEALSKLNCNENIPVAETKAKATDNSAIIVPVGQVSEENKVSSKEETTKMKTDNPKLLEYGVDINKPFIMTKEIKAKMKAKGQKGFWESVKDGLGNTIPFAALINDSAKRLKLLSCTNKLEEAGFKKLTKEERETLIEFQLEFEEEQQRGSSFWGKLGYGLTHVPAIIGELYLVGGIGTVNNRVLQIFYKSLGATSKKVAQLFLKEVNQNSFNEVSSLKLVA